jgi:hypothetical protein
MVRIHFPPAESLRTIGPLAAERNRETAAIGWRPDRGRGLAAGPRRDHGPDGGPASRRRRNRATLVLRQAGRGAALGAADRALPAAPRVSAAQAPSAVGFGESCRGRTARGLVPDTQRSSR